MESKYVALAIGLADELFTVIQPMLSTHQLTLIPSTTVKDASQLLSQQVFHLLIVNIEYLRDIQQIDWLNGIRHVSFAPMIVVSSSPGQDIHPMVQLGADICLPDKCPSLIAELSHSLLRRYTEYNHFNNPRNMEVTPFALGDIFIDPPRHIVEVRGNRINLKRREFSLLLYFMRNPGIVLTSEQICENAWGMEEGYNQGVSHPIRLLRQAIEPDPKKPIYIQTKYGLGYRFTPNYVETCEKC